MCCPLETAIVGRCKVAQESRDTMETATVGRCKVAQESRDTRGNVLYMECVRIYRYSLRDDPKGRSSHPHQGRSLKSRTVCNVGCSAWVRNLVYQQDKFYKIVKSTL